jgi:hypothetical protein
MPTYPIASKTATDLPAELDAVADEIEDLEELAAAHAIAELLELDEIVDEIRETLKRRLAPRQWGRPCCVTKSSAASTTASTSPVSVPAPRWR